VRDASAKLHETGAVVYAVTLSRDYSLPELQIYAGSVDRVYTGDRVQQFLTDIGQRTNAQCASKRAFVRRDVEVNK
jgi:hypothetical protein